MTAPFGESEHGWDPRFDDGLTRERTLWAWHRTGMAFGVNAILLAKGFHATSVAPLGYGLAVLVLVLGATAYAMGEYRFKNRFWRKRIGRARDRAFRTMSLGSFAIAAATIVLIVLED